MKQIAIIGAGLSGTLLAMNLLQKARGKAVKIWLIDRNAPEDLGPAYSTNEDYLLNVPVEMMGAVSREPEHFLKWSRQKNIQAVKGDYLPRKLYRTYIQSLLNTSIQEKSSKGVLERIRGEAYDVRLRENRANVFVKDYGEIAADRVILALGNFLPREPVIKNVSFFKDRRYIRNPWAPDLLDRIERNNVIIFIGSGQTMIDLATGLYRKKHQGRILTISRRGLLPLSQKRVESYPSFYEELRGEKRLLPVFQTVRRHLETAGRKGLDPRAVIDSLRPHTSLIWMNFPDDEKRRFLRHLFRYWEIIRSRIPPESEKIIHQLQKSGQMKLLSGSIVDFVANRNKIEMTYLTRDSKNLKRESADLVINCVGPDLDYEHREEALVKNLLKKKLIHCDSVHLGINARPDGAVIQTDGTASDILYTIGLTLKGIVWEALAAPEIRVQAENLARKLLAN